MLAGVAGRTKRYEIGGFIQAAPASWYQVVDMERLS
jgi:hypothetical protein